MNKNKFGRETKWSLYKVQPDKNYPSVLYIWLDENKRVRYGRTAEPYGFMPYPFNIIVEEGEPFTNLKTYFGKNLKKVSNHSMTDEHLSKGWLLF